MELTHDVLKAIDNYYDVLENTGYIPYSQVYKLLVLSFIEEMLTEEMSEFISEKDYRSISKYLDCLYGTCLIPYRQYLKGIAVPTGDIIEHYRVTEDNQLRTTEKFNSKLRK